MIRNWKPEDCSPDIATSKEDLARRRTAGHAGWVTCLARPVRARGAPDTVLLIVLKQNRSDAPAAHVEYEKLPVTAAVSYR
jgi:hypothetical protein